MLPLAYQIVGILSVAVIGLFAVSFNVRLFPVAPNEMTAIVFGIPIVVDFSFGTSKTPVNILLPFSFIFVHESN